MQVYFYSPQGTHFQAEAQEVHLPGCKARFTLLENHAPILSSLSAGPLRIVTKTEELSWSIASGFVDVQNNRVSIAGTGVTAL